MENPSGDRENPNDENPINEKCSVTVSHHLDAVNRSFYLIVPQILAEGGLGPPVAAIGWAKPTLNKKWRSTLSFM